MATGYSEAHSESQAELKGGTIETAATAVVSIYRQGTFVCSGTLVDPRVVVTAAHCLTPHEEALTISDPSSLLQDFISVIDSRVPPGYRKEGWPDVAVLALEKPPASAVPAILVHDRMAPIEPGLPVQLAGFGRTVLGEEPTERKGSALVVDAGEDGLLIEGDGCAPCFGDSGGPVLEAGDGGPRLLAVISNGGVECAGQFKAARVDTQAETLLAPYIALLHSTSKQFGARCIDSPSCESRICSDYGTGLNTCASSCAGGLPCPSGHECLEYAGTKVCRPITVFGAIGSPCEDDQECRSKICVKREGSGFCATACSPGGNAQCPDAFACIANDMEPEPFLCEPTAASVARSGCAIARPHAAATGHASPVFAAVTAGVILRVRRRRRSPPSVLVQR